MITLCLLFRHSTCLHIYFIYSRLLMQCGPLHHPLLKIALTHRECSSPTPTTMSQDTTTNSTPLPSTISGSATFHVMDQQLIPWALYDLSGARAPDSLETMQDYFRHFRGLCGKSLENIGYDALQSSWCAFIRR